jgi:hypothetical protein
LSFTCRDEYALEPLLPIDKPKPLNSHAALCPLVSRGVDRLKIAMMLKERGIETSKDVASTISYKMVSISSNAYY